MPVRHGRGTGVRRPGAAAVALMLGAALIALGGPRMLAAFAGIPGDPVLVQLQQREPVAAPRLERLADSRRNAVTFAASPDLMGELGFAELALAAADPSGMSSSLLEDAAGHIRAELGAAPLRPQSWTRLAYAETLRDGASPDIGHYLRMARATGPFEPRLPVSRFELYLSRGQALGPEERRQAREEVGIAWRDARNRAALAEVAHRHGGANLVRSALFPDRDSLAEFERLLAGAAARQDD